MKLATTAKLPKKTTSKLVDLDNPPWTEDMLGAPILKRGRGPQIAPVKVLTSIRLDTDVLAFFKSLGSGYQSRINETLRKELERSLGESPPTALQRSVGF